MQLIISMNSILVSGKKQLKGKFYKVEQTKTSKIWKYNLNEFKN